MMKITDETTPEPAKDGPEPTRWYVTTDPTHIGDDAEKYPLVRQSALTACQQEVERLRAELIKSRNYWSEQCSDLNQRNSTSATPEEIYAAQLPARPVVKALDLSTLLRDAFLAGRGLIDGDKLSEADQRAWAEYDPERMNAYKRITTALSALEGKAQAAATQQNQSPVVTDEEAIRALEIFFETAPIGWDYRTITRMRAALEAALSSGVRVVDVLEWYREQAAAARRFMVDKEANADALLAILTALSLDGGRRAEAALEAAQLPARPVVTPDDDIHELYLDALAEAEKAMRKYPQPNYVISKVAEEAGEVVKDAIHCAEGRETHAKLVGEIKQAIAMLLRLYIEGDQVHGLTPPRAALSALEGEGHE